MTIRQQGLREIFRDIALILGIIVSVVTLTQVWEYKGRNDRRWIEQDEVHIKIDKRLSDHDASIGRLNSCMAAHTGKPTN
jgi:hypothetical protein